MLNPILQRINPKQNQNNLIQRLKMAKDFLKTKNPDAIYNDLMNTNPQFKQFANDVKDKSLEEIALEYDLDINLLRQFF